MLRHVNILASHALPIILRGTQTSPEFHFSAYEPQRQSEVGHFYIFAVFLSNLTFNRRHYEKSSVLQELSRFLVSVHHARQFTRNHHHHVLSRQ